MALADMIDDAPTLPDALPLDSIICGDSLDVLRTLPSNSVDAIVTDPPAGIAFMGKRWDSDHGGRDHWIRAFTAIYHEALRVLKPGGHALVWALPRTSHWTAMALEDAGWEVRDRVAHITGQGFPKSLNLHGDHEGWGTALKPAVEDWWLVRKPLAEKTVAANVLRWGTGALNIGASRVNPGVHVEGGGTFGGVFGNGKPANHDGHNLGRWPSHLLLSHSLWCDETTCALDCPIRALDAQSGMLHARGNKTPTKRRQSNGAWGMNGATIGVGPDGPVNPGDTGGASRYFTTFKYTAKASRSERNRGCETLPKKTNDFQRATSGLSQGKNPVTGERSGITMGPRANHHPTVKPLALMSWLITLITPPGGLVLDCFAGSGSTLVAAKMGGWRYLGIEREAEYVAIAEARIQAS